MPPKTPRGAPEGDPRQGPNHEEIREHKRRQAMVDLVRASRGGGLLSLPGQLNETDRQEILAKGEDAEAWKKLQGAGPAGGTPGAGLGLGRIGLLLGVLAALVLVLLAVTG